MGNRSGKRNHRQPVLTGPDHTPPITPLLRQQITQGAAPGPGVMPLPEPLTVFQFTRNQGQSHQLGMGVGQRHSCQIPHIGKEGEHLQPDVLAQIPHPPANQTVQLQPDSSPQIRRTSLMARAEHHHLMGPHPGKPVALSPRLCPQRHLDPKGREEVGDHPQFPGSRSPCPIQLRRGLVLLPRTEGTVRFLPGGKALPGTHAVVGTEIALGSHDHPFMPQQIAAHLGLFHASSITPRPWRRDHHHPR